MRNRVPLVSFSFDDFPSSALSTGGRILEDHGVFGTYYTSLGLMGKMSPSGKIFESDEIPLAFHRGHELGCHTFAHCHAYDTPASIFEGSIIQNRLALQRLLPEASFKTLSYPISCPSPAAKKRSGKHFLACRGGGQTFNVGIIDLNHLHAFFIEQSRDYPKVIENMIETNCAASGWLIFATHDVCANPTRYGCTPSLFEHIVTRCIESGACVLSVSSALSEIGLDPSNCPPSKAKTVIAALA
jgi:peptidoglycan/xylan/chitin deacetylase (PgdA/CDA1 family)